MPDDPLEDSLRQAHKNAKRNRRRRTRHRLMMYMIRLAHAFTRLSSILPVRTGDTPHSERVVKFDEYMRVLIDVGGGRFLNCRQIEHYTHIVQQQQMKKELEKEKERKMELESPPPPPPPPPPSPPSPTERVSALASILALALDPAMASASAIAPPGDRNDCPNTLPQRQPLNSLDPNPHRLRFQTSKKTTAELLLDAGWLLVDDDDEWKEVDESSDEHEDESEAEEDQDWELIHLD